MRTKVHLVQFLIFFFFTADFEKGRERILIPLKLKKARALCLSVSQQNTEKVNCPSVPPFPLRLMGWLTGEDSNGWPIALQSKLKRLKRCAVLFMG